MNDVVNDNEAQTQPCVARYVRIQQVGFGQLALSQVVVNAKQDDTTHGSDIANKKKVLKPPLHKGDRVLVRARGHSSNTCYVEFQCVSCTSKDHNGTKWTIDVVSPYKKDKKKTLVYPPKELEYLLQPKTPIEPSIGARVTAPFGDESAPDGWAWYCGSVVEWKGGHAKVKFDDGTSWKIDYPSKNRNLLDTSKPNRLCRSLVGAMQPNELPMFVLAKATECAELTAGTKSETEDVRGQFVTSDSVDSFQIIDGLFSKSAIQGVVEITNRWSLENDGRSPLEESGPLSLTENDVEGFSARVHEHLRRCHMEVKIEVLKAINKMVLSALPYVDMGLRPGFSALTDQIKLVKTWMFTHAKQKILRAALDKTLYPRAKGVRDYVGPGVALDVLAAGNVTMKRQTDHKARRTLFGQLYQSLRHKGGDMFKIDVNQRAFRANYLGVGSIDAGGPYRDALENMSREIQSPALPMFVRTPNGRTDAGLNRDAFVPRTSSKGLLHAGLYRFFGRLCGLAIRSNNLMNLSFPSLVWKPLVGDPVLDGDVEAVDNIAFKQIKSIKNLVDTLSDLDFNTQFESYRFTCCQCDGKVVPLVPGGVSKKVTKENYKLYIRCLRKARLEEFDFHCAAIRQGIGEVIPLESLSLFTWKELEMIVCGEGVTKKHIANLRRMTHYSQCSASDKHVQFFWKMMTDVFDDRQRAKFISFAWGRSRLPNTCAEYEQKFKIVRHNASAAAGNADQHYPIAHTCFFQVELPRYSNLEAMCKKFILAIEGCGTIDADGDVNESFGSSVRVEETAEDAAAVSFWDD